MLGLGAVASIAAKSGATIVKSVLDKHVGGLAGSLAGTIVDEVAHRVGVAPDDLAKAPVGDLTKAVEDVEASMPEVIALWQKGLEGQFALFEADRQEGLLATAWRWGWMYLLAFFWICAFLFFPVIRLFGVAIDPIDTAALMTLTGWFISLYMGGHTVKVLGKQAIDAAKAWRK